MEESFDPQAENHCFKLAQISPPALHQRYRPLAFLVFLASSRWTDGPGATSQS